MWYNQYMSIPLGHFPLDLEIPTSYPYPGEDTSYPRRYWVNRKANKVTVSASYMHVGITKTQKKWYQWRQAWSVSFTVRTRKDGTKTFNAFMVSKMGRVTSIMNVTPDVRQITEYLSEHIMPTVVEEAASLLIREKIITSDEYKKVSEFANQNHTITLFSLIMRAAYPTVNSLLNPKGSKPNEFFNVSIENGLPYPASAILRAGTMEQVATHLKLRPENAKKLKDNASTLPLKTLYILDLLKGYTTLATETKLIDDIIAHGNNSDFLKRVWDISVHATYTPQVRQILRTVSRTQLQKVIFSTFFFEDLSNIMEKWVGLSKNEKKVMVDSPVHDLREAWAISWENIKAKKEAQSINPDDFREMLSTFTDGKIIQVQRDSGYIEMNYGVYSFWINSGIVDRRNGTPFSRIPFQMGYGIKKEHPLWKPILKSPHFVRGKVELTGYSSGQNYRPVRSSQEGSFTPKLYMEFIQSILKEAETRLTKHGIPITVESRTFAFALVYFEMIQHHDKYFQSMGNKALKLYKMGFNNYMIYQLIKRRTSLKAAKSYEGLPESWVRNILSIPEPPVHEPF